MGRRSVATLGRIILGQQDLSLRLTDRSTDVLVEGHKFYLATQTS